MTGRLRSVAVSSTSLELADYAPRRLRITFSVVNSVIDISLGIIDSSVMINNIGPATTSEGFPLAMSTGLLTLEGRAAAGRFEAIRLSGQDVRVGVFEEFDESSGIEDDPIPVVSG